MRFENILTFSVMALIWRPRRRWRRFGSAAWFPCISRESCRSWGGWRERGASSCFEAWRPQRTGGTGCWLTSVCSCWCPNSKRKASLRFSWFCQFYRHPLWLSRSWSKSSAFPPSMWHIYYAAHRKGRKRALDDSRLPNTSSQTHVLRLQDPLIN